MSTSVKAGSLGNDYLVNITLIIERNSRGIQTRLSLRATRSYVPHIGIFCIFICIGFMLSLCILIRQECFTNRVYLLVYA